MRLSLRGMFTGREPLHFAGNEHSCRSAPRAPGCEMMEQMKLSGAVRLSGLDFLPESVRFAEWDPRSVWGCVSGCGASGRSAYPEQVPIFHEAPLFFSVFPKTFIINEVPAE